MDTAYAGKQLLEIRLFYGEIQNEQEGHQHQHSMENTHKNPCGNQPFQAVNQGENHGNGSYGKSPVGVVAAGFHFLTVSLQYIEES